MAKKKSQQSSTLNNKVLAVVSSCLNLVMPGLGSAVGGRSNPAAAQLLLTALAAFMFYFEAPALLIGAAAGSTWLWALSTSVEMLRATFKR